MYKGKFSILLSSSSEIAMWIVLTGAIILLVFVILGALVRLTKKVSRSNKGYLSNQQFLQQKKDILNDLSFSVSSGFSQYADVSGEQKSASNDREPTSSNPQLAAKSKTNKVDTLKEYYNDLLDQSWISFWFSLISASLGFVVIIVSIFRYTNDSDGASITQLIAGIVIDAVAALFFFQLRNIQKLLKQTLTKVFEDKNEDQRQREAQKLCSEITNEEAKNAVRVQMALHYAQLPKSNKIAISIIKECLSDSEKVSSKVSPPATLQNVQERLSLAK